MEGMTWSTRIRLSAMMFLQYMMFAVFWAQMASYLTNMEVSLTWKSWILSTMPLGCLVAPVICMIADRHFASQKVLTILNFACAVLFFVAARQTSPGALFVVLLLATCCYMPTWGLTNTIAMTNAPAEKFPQIRVFGSIGWVASLVFSVVAATRLFGEKAIDGTAIPLYCGAGTALLAALLTLTLPNTPPPAKGKEASIVDALGLRALGLMKDRNFALFIIVSLLSTIPFTLYFSYGSEFFSSQGYETITARMNLGQLSEILVMLLVPISLAKLGVKRTMAIGLVALAVRYLAFWGGVATGQTFMYYVAILVHGVIFGFFYVGGQVYVDKKAPPEMRAQAQGLIVLICWGIGMLIGTQFSGALIGRYTTDGIYNWNAVFMVTSIISVAVLAGLIALFKDDVKNAEVQAAGETPEKGEEAEA